jgi:formamidopyrimidine-DNA glycosylase
MPELPEVETTLRGLKPALQGTVLEQVAVRQTRLRVPVPPDFSNRVAGARVEALRRRGKYLLWELNTGETIILHLGMSGRLTLQPAVSPPQKHDHILFHLPGGRDIRYNDVRRFGLVFLARTEQVGQHALLRSLGPEPLDGLFTPAYLYEQLQRRQSPIKNVLLDGRVVAGLGNIYVNEALFRAGIYPEQPACDIIRREVTNLVISICAVLEEALAAGGTTLRDYVQADGSLGYFHEQFRVYGRVDEPCLVCKTAIEKMVVGQRGTYYCPHCQPKKVRACS